MRITTSRFMIQQLFHRQRQAIVVIIHLLLIPLSNYLAFWLRFDGEIPQRFFELMTGMFPALLLIRASILFWYRLFQGSWRYTSIWDLWNIVTSTFAGTLLFYILVHIILKIEAYPRSVFVLDSILLIFLLGGIRLSWRIRREFNRSFQAIRRKRVLIYGAGDAGEMVARDMKKRTDYDYEPTGFVDDDVSKVGQRIHGIPVLGTRGSLSQIISAQKIHEVIVAIPSADPSIMREVLKSLQPFNIPIKTLPNLSDILDGKITVSQIRNLSVEDLMTRVPVNLDLTPVAEMLHARRVLVTGAAGSIGAELCRQIAKLHPRKLVLFERYENGLFEITNELVAKGYKDLIQPVIGDITDEAHVNRFFEKHNPEVVFHAAAHKHVPLMEQNPCEAVKNNITGTRILAEAAVKSDVSKFVFISTDKAVNPTSVMGASKRVGESLIQAMSENDATSFVAVRFGNVLASNGSVVPLFLEQIKRGGPVTVTDPEMRRYFMLIPEAVQLVLLAAAMSGNAETYVLEMGEQINVAEMARNIIRLSGFVPDVEIPIVFTGLRPGEKLFEELVAEDEIAEPSSVPEILKIRQGRPLDPIFLFQKIRQLEEFSIDGNDELILESLADLIPNFKVAVHRKEISRATH